MASFVVTMVDKACIQTSMLLWFHQDFLSPTSNSLAWSLGCPSRSAFAYRCSRLNISLYKILLDPPYRSWRLSGREQNETDSESNVSDAFRCEWSAEDVFSTLSTLDPEFCARKVSYLKQRLYKKDALSITDLGIDFSDLHPFYGSTRNFILPREGSNVSAEMKDCIPPYLIDDESNGEAEEVTEESLDEYLNVLCRHRLLDSVWRPLASMCPVSTAWSIQKSFSRPCLHLPDRGRPLAASPPSPRVTVARRR